MTGKPSGSCSRDQFDAAIDIPRHNQNGTLSLFDHLPKSTEIRGAIHQKRDAVGVLDAPAVSARLENGECPVEVFSWNSAVFLCQCRFSGKIVPSYIHTRWTYPFWVEKRSRCSRFIVYLDRPSPSALKSAYSLYCPSRCHRLETTERGTVKGAACPFSSMQATRHVFLYEVIHSRDEHDAGTKQRRWTSCCST